MAQEKKKTSETPKKIDDKAADVVKKDKDAGAGEVPTATSGLPKFVFPAVLAGVVVLNMIMAFVFVTLMMPKKSSEDDSAVQVDSLHASEESHGFAAEGMTVTEKPIEAIVNIAGTEGKRYFKVGMVLEYNAVKYKELGHAVEEHLMPKLKSVLIEQISTLTLEELNQPQIKEKIRKEYLRRVNSILPKKMGEFHEALITTFLIQ